MADEADSRQIKHLARKAAHGNVEAFGELIHMHQEYLYRTAFLYMKNEDAALDVVQDCILKAFEAIGKLRNPEFFRTWITRILINCANQAQRDRGRMSGYGENAEMPDHTKAMIEERCDLHQAMEHLPEMYRKVVILKYYNNLKIQEISEVLGIPEGSVKAYLYRAKRELRTFLKEDYLYAE